MTRAPDNLLNVRRLLLTHLQPHGLAPAAVGVVGDPAHRGGYHCGSDRVVANDYSVVESSRDRSGLTLDASGLDVGQFSVQSGKRTHDLRSFSVWCVAQCEAGTADARDIREIIYSPDGKVVRRWDRLGRRTTGDSSHRWHTHFSFFRDSTKAGRDQTPLFRRYLTTIGLIQEADDVTPDDIERVAARTKGLVLGDGGVQQLLTRVYEMRQMLPLADAELADARVRQEAILRAVTGGTGPQILAAIQAEGERTRAELAAVAAADARRDGELAELVRQVDTGELDAAEVVRLIGERLAGTTPQS